MPLCQPAFWFSTSFGLCIQLNGGRCIPEQQWRPCFRRSKLYSLMAATRWARPGGMASTSRPLESTFFSSSTSSSTSSYHSWSPRARSPCVRSREWMDGAGCGRLVAVASGTTVESESRLCQVRETPDFTVVTRQSQKQGFSTQASLFLRLQSVGC